MEENKNKVDDIIEEIMSGEHTRERVNGMRKKADLTDIILEKEKSSISSAQKKKKMLLAIASLVLLFLIFLIISKMINSSPDETIDSESNKNSIKTQQEVSHNVVNKDENSDNLKNDTDIKFDELVKKLREQDSKESSGIKTTKNDDITPKVEPKSKVVAKPKVKEPKELEKPKVAIKKPKIAITSNPPKTHAKKQSKISHRSGKNGFYIQVGATTKPVPNHTLVSKIRNSGYSYTVHPVMVKGRRFYKILIGPYSSKAKALSQINIVRVNINPKAYIFYLRK